MTVRGTPYSTGAISVHHNWSYHPTDFYFNHHGDIWYELGPICQEMSFMADVGYATSDTISYGPFVRMTVYDNWYGTTAPPSTNGAPVLDAVGNKAAVELATLAFTISATDPDGDTLTYSASNLPQGASFDPSTRTFSWTPEDSQAGVYANIRFQVSDGSLSDTEDIAITVTASSSLQGDVNGDGSVNALDMIRVGQHWGETGVGGWIREDINQDGTVNVLDATLVGQHWTG
jgi:hypothetical protein